MVNRRLLYKLNKHFGTVHDIGQGICLYAPHTPKQPRDYVSSSLIAFLSERPRQFRKKSCLWVNENIVASAEMLASLPESADTSDAPVRRL